VTVIILILLTSSVFAVEDGGFGDIGSVIGDNEDPYLTETIEQALAGNINTDLSQFRSKESLALSILRDKGYNLNTVEGFRIEGGVLKHSDGSTIKPNGQITIQTTGNFIGTVTTDDLTVIGGQGIHYDGTSLNIDRADSVSFQETESENIRQFKGKPDEITIVKADVIITKGSTLNNVLDTKITKEKITAKCGVGGGSMILPTVNLECQLNDYIEITYLEDGVEIILPKDVTFTTCDNTIKGEAEKDNAFLRSQKLANICKVTSSGFTQYTYENSEITESILAEGETTAFIDAEEGIYELSLGTNSRFTSKNKNTPSQDYFILNKQTSTFAIEKPSHNAVAESTLKQNNKVMKGKFDFGTFVNGIPKTVIKSHKDNKISLDYDHLKLTTTEPCTNPNVFFEVHNEDFHIIEVCTPDGFKRYVDFESNNNAAILNDYEASHAEARIIFSTHALSQVQQSGRIVRMYSQDLTNLENYHQVYQQCRMWQP